MNILSHLLGTRKYKKGENEYKELILNIKINRLYLANLEKMFLARIVTPIKDFPGEIITLLVFNSYFCLNFSRVYMEGQT